MDALAGVQDGRAGVSNATIRHLDPHVMLGPSSSSEVKTAASSRRIAGSVVIGLPMTMAMAPEVLLEVGV